MPFIMCFQGPPGAEPLNHTPLPHVNSLSSKLIDGKLCGRASQLAWIMHDPSEMCGKNVADQWLSSQVKSGP
jgi:hypothetical protein